MARAGGAWDPAQYNRFAAEREQPFWDLRSLLEPARAPRVADLGCGDGRLTAALHRKLRASTTVGIDSSAAMLAEAGPRAAGTLRFEAGDIGAWAGSGYDIVLSNAALQWLPDHAEVLARWRDALAAGGQLAVQVPANADHASHAILRDLAAEILGADAPPDPVAANVLRPEDYAVLLSRLGFARQHVRLQVYIHRLSTSTQVVEWMKGSSLTRLRNVMPEGAYADLVEEYAARVRSALGEASPYLYGFKRILMWGRVAGDAVVRAGSSVLDA